MTERLYYKDPGLIEFEASVIKAGEVDGKAYVVLDRTAFYPTSGGQPHDNGQLNDIKVLDVLVDDNDVIRHILEKQLNANTVKGKIDYDRRQYFRQLHTAQHILSAAFIELFNYETVSVHLGEDYGAIELLTPDVTLGQTSQAEQRSNLAIEQNHPIEIIFADENQAAQLPLRKKPERAGIIRVIRIGDLDWSACGGTHCNSTAEVGIIKILALEKQRGNALVKFLAGKKAIEDYVHRFEITDKLTKDLTCAVTDLPDKFHKLSSESKELKKQLVQLQSGLLPIRAKQLSEKAAESGNYKLVFESVTEIDPKHLNQLANEIAGNIEGIAGLILGNRLCLAVSDKSGLDAGKIVKQLSEKFELRGGGGKTLAQLGGVSSDNIEKYKKELLAILNE